MGLEIAEVEVLLADVKVLGDLEPIRVEQVIELTGCEYVVAIAVTLTRAVDRWKIILSHVVSRGAAEFLQLELLDVSLNRLQDPFLLF